jgi:hypothetical protein
MSSESELLAVDSADRFGPDHTTRAFGWQQPALAVATHGVLHGVVGR